VHRLAPLHLGSVLEAEEMQETVHERCAPPLSDDLWTQDRVAELARDAGLQRLAAVDGERENVGRFVDAEMLVLQLPDLVGADEGEAELALLDALGGEHLPRELDRAELVDVLPASILDLDRHHGPHLRRSVPVSSACSR